MKEKGIRIGLSAAIIVEEVARASAGSDPNKLEEDQRVLNAANQNPFESSIATHPGSEDSFTNIVYPNEPLHSDNKAPISPENSPQQDESPVPLYVEQYPGINPDDPEMLQLLLNDRLFVQQALELYSAAPIDQGFQTVMAVKQNEEGSEIALIRAKTEIDNNALKLIDQAYFLTIDEIGNVEVNGIDIAEGDFFGAAVINKNLRLTYWDQQTKKWTLLSNEGQEDSYSLEELNEEQAKPARFFLPQITQSPQNEKDLEISQSSVTGQNPEYQLASFVEAPEPSETVLLRTENLEVVEINPQSYELASDHPLKNSFPNSKIYKTPDNDLFITNENTGLTLAGQEIITQYGKFTFLIDPAYYRDFNMVKMNSEAPGMVAYPDYANSDATDNIHRVFGTLSELYFNEHGIYNIDLANHAPDEDIIFIIAGVARSGRVLQSIKPAEGQKIPNERTYVTGVISGTAPFKTDSGTVILRSLKTTEDIGTYSPNSTTENLLREHDLLVGDPKDNLGYVAGPDPFRQSLYMLAGVDVAERQGQPREFGGIEQMRQTAFAPLFFEDPAINEGFSYPLVSELEISINGVIYQGKDALEKSNEIFRALIEGQDVPQEEFEFLKSRIQRSYQIKDNLKALDITKVKIVPESVMLN